MLKSCQYCGRIHDSKFDCGKKPKKKRYFTNATNFRGTRQWRKKRDDIKERDLYLCQVCKDKGKGKGKYVYDNLEVHHIVPIEENYDLRLDNDNLITLCRKHHEDAEDGTISREYQRELIKGRDRG